MEMRMPLRFSSSRLLSDAFFIPHLLHRSPKTKTPSFTTTAIITSSSCFRTRPPDQVNILVVGSTGYIGKFVVSELCRRGFHVISIKRIRDNGAISEHQQQQYGGRTTVCFSDVTDLDALNRSLASLALPLDAAVCCLASRTGGVQDSWRVDYKASRNSLAAARRHGATHFVLLSAICVQKPLLEFQRAKLRFETELSAEAAEDPSFSYSIVRPTAFFKSLAGQVDAVKEWKMPFVLFGDGKLCSCKPISARDLASFIADCVVDESKAGKVLPVGGPGKALTPMQQAEILFRLLGRQPSFAKVPVGALDFVIQAMEMLAKIFPAFMEDAAELGRIVRYYAVESMLVLDSDTGHYSQEKTPSYGTDTLEDFLAAAIRDGMNGQ